MAFKDRIPPTACAGRWILRLPLTPFTPRPVMAAWLLGYEVDRVFPGQIPANAVVLGASLPPPSPANDACSAVQNQMPHSNMTLYTPDSGAFVFATGSMHWNWALDPYDPDGCEGSSNKCPRTASAEPVREIMRNVLIEMTR